MISDFRAAVADLAGKDDVVPVIPTIPDDVAHVPCVVIGRVTGTQGDELVTEDLELDMVLVGRRQRADDPLAVGGELDNQCDALFATFGGTRGIRHLGWSLDVTSRRPAIVSVAGLEYEAYMITVVGSHTTCST